jgi:drug/metabolite transporter, DME family
MVGGAALLWGTLGLFGRLLYAVGFVPIELASVRAGVCFAGLSLWLLARRTPLRLRPRDIPFFAVFGVIAIALFEWLYFAAVELVTLSLAASLLYTAPAFVILYLRVAEHARIPRPQLLSLAMVLAGVMLVTGTLRTLGVVGFELPWRGILFGLLSGVTYACYTLFGRRALRAYDPVEATFYAFAFGALALAFVVPPWRPLLAHPPAIPALIALGIFPTLVAYLLYINSLRHLSAPAAAMIATAEPVIATFVGLVFLGEVIFPEQGLGVLLIVGAALVVARGERKDAGRPDDRVSDAG